MLDKQKYPQHVIDDAVQKARKLKRDDVLMKRPPQGDPQRTNLCLTHSMNFPNVNKIPTQHSSSLNYTSLSNGLMGREGRKGN